MKRQQRKFKRDEEKLHNPINDQRLSLPSLNSHFSRNHNQTYSKASKTLSKYNLQRKIQPLADDRSIFGLQGKLTGNLHSSKEFYPKEKRILGLAKFETVEISFSKRMERLNKLPDILSQAKFVRKNEESLNTSQEEDDHVKRQVFCSKSYSSVEPQLWIIKKQAFQTSPRTSLQRIISENLQAQGKMLPPSMITQPSSISPQKHLQSIEYTLLSKTKLVGPLAVQRFYSQYKKIDRVKQLQEMCKEYNPITVILTILQNYNIPPKRMDIIKLKGNESILDLNQIGLGQSISIKAISDILEKIKYFKSINISQNAITFDRVDIIIPQLKGLRKIDLSHNRISRQGVDLLASSICVQEKNPNEDEFSSSCSSFDSQDDRLEQLNLQQNGLSDQSLNLFLKNAKFYRHIKILNLSKNFLGSNFALRLKEFLINENHLRQLYLHWNDITSKGMKHIFEGLTMNAYLKVLDLSWNQVGFEAIPAICTFIRKNTSLIHLDISNCNISFKDTEEIALSLQHNFTIIGLHYEGNQGKVDPMGFVLPQMQGVQTTHNLLREQILQRINGVQPNNVCNSQYRINDNSSLKTCWICDGWMEQTVVVKKNVQIDQACFIHFDFEQFKGVAMGQVEQNYKLTKMFPAKRIVFFITKVNKCKQFIHQAAFQYKQFNKFDTLKLSNPLRIGSFFIQQKEFKKVQLTKVNVISNVNVSYEALFDKRYLYQLSCRPRTNGAVVDRSLFFIEKNQKVRRKKQRNRDNDKKARELQSIQLVFTSDSNAYSKTFIQQCADFDISHSKIRKLLRQSEQVSSISQILSEHYSTFTNIYRHLSSHAVNSVNSVFYVSETRLQQFLDSVQLEDKDLTRAKIRLKLVATLSVNDDFSKAEGKPSCEQKLLTRPQFFEFLLRIAIEKYCRTKNNDEEKITLNSQDGFQKLMVLLEKYEKTLTAPQVWRTEHLQIYDISLVIRFYSHFLQSLYDVYAGSNQRNMNTRIEKKMLLNEFKQIFLDSGMRKTREALKDAEIAFAESKQHEAEEGIKEQGLSYQQFLEAMARMAFNSQLKPIGSQENKVWERILETKNLGEFCSWGPTSFEVPLFLKLETLMKKIYQENRQLHHSLKMDRIFDKGLFGDEIEMLVQIFNQRVQQIHDGWAKVKRFDRKVKVNFIEEEMVQRESKGRHENLRRRITLEYLVKELKQKYRKMAEQLDRNFEDYEQVSEPLDTA